MSNVYIYEEQPRLVYSFKDFIEVIESAAVTYHQIDLPEGDTLTGEIRFNLFSSIEKYQSSLKNIFSRMVKEMDEAVKNRYPKLEKLNFLSLHITEVAALKDLFQTKSGKTTHQTFTFNNLTVDEQLNKIVLKQDELQLFLNAGLNMVIKFQRHFDELKRNVELIKQEDFELPPSMNPDPNEATYDNPLAYFEYLISKNGVFKLLRDFKPSEDEYDYGYVSYDDDTQTKNYEEQDLETGEWDTVTYKFSDHLYSILVKQFNQAKSFMDLAVNKAETKKRIKLSITLWISILTYLKGQVELNNNFKNYEILARPIKSLITYLYEKYGDFCPEPNKIAQELLKTSKQYQLPESKPLAIPQLSQPAMFRWTKGLAEKNSTTLHAVLNKNFIQNIELTDFHKAFSGGYPEHNYKIRWVDMTPNGKHTNKVTLLYLFKKLAGHGLIDLPFESPELIIRLGRIFQDHKGQPLVNLPQSKSGLSKAKKEFTHAKSQLDKVIAVLIE